MYFYKDLKDGKVRASEEELEIAGMVKLPELEDSSVEVGGYMIKKFGLFDLRLRGFDKREYQKVARAYMRTWVPVYEMKSFVERNLKWLVGVGLATRTVDGGEG